MWRCTYNIVTLFLLLLLFESYLTGSIYQAWQEGKAGQGMVIGLLWLMICVLCGLCMDILRCKPADSHTIQSLFWQYYAEIWGKRKLAQLLKSQVDISTKDCRKHQNEVLMGILKRHADTEYGQKFSFASVTCRGEYAKRLPLTTDSDYSKYIDRMANGENNITTADDVVYLALTSEIYKLFPFTNHVVSSPMYKQGFACRHHIHRSISKAVGLRRIFKFRIFHLPCYSPAGIRIGEGADFILKDSIYNISPDKLCSTIVNVDAMFYIQALFALKDKDIGMIDGISSDLMLLFFKYIDEHWPDLCKDIEAGYIRPHPHITERIRAKLKTHFHANPKRAQILRKVFNLKRPGRALRIWPHLAAVFMRKTGSYDYNAQILGESYFQGVNMFCTFLMSTNDLLAMQFEQDPTSDIFTFIPHFSIFLEFIPEANLDDENPNCLFLDQLEIGQKYEIVITNSGGFYRKRSGYVVKIVATTGDTPKLIFQYRLGQHLSVSSERTSMSNLNAAVQLLRRKWTDSTLVEYTFCESFHLQSANEETPGKNKYIVFLEMYGDMVLTKKEKSELDNCLCEVHDRYKQLRDQGRIDAAYIQQVKPGTFSALPDILMEGNMNEQFKMPRILRNHEALKHLWENRLPYCL